MHFKMYNVAQLATVQIFYFTKVLITDRFDFANSTLKVLKEKAILELVKEMSTLNVDW